ncbi:MAG: flagellar basal-body MS-ring/collar protein FliF [Novosphingobium sp.]
MKRRQLILFGAVMAGVFTVLCVLYFAFLRPGYAVLYEDLREADVAAIVGELEKQGIAYRLADQGRSVLVPEDEASHARVIVAGSGITMGGVVGFELFNESDMGLTEFAQKVNYQRALQGELARTIMLMDGISSARVHLSLPERALFRAVQHGPKAAVTVQTVGKHALNPDQIAGIQRLVASTVTGLSSADVAILDDQGDLVSPVAAEPAQGGASGERGALEEYFRARAAAAAERIVPGAPFEIRVSALDLDAVGPDAPMPMDRSGPPAGEARNFKLRIAFRSEGDLNPENEERIRQTITQAVGLDPARGDILRFETGPLGLPENSGLGRHGDPRSAFDDHSAALPSAPAQSAGDWASWPPYPWLLGGLAILAAIAVARFRQRSRLTGEEQQSFADVLSATLSSRELDRDER